MKKFKNWFLKISILMFSIVSTGNAAVDICYSDKSTSGLCTPFMGFFCSQNTTLESISSSVLSDVNISKGYIGFAMTWNPTLKIDGVGKTVAVDNPDNGDSIERAERTSTFGGSIDTAFGNTGMGFGLGGYEYHLGSMSLGDDHTISDGYMMSMGFTLPTSGLIAEYIKDGVYYTAPIPPCSSPYFSISAANVTEGNSGTKTMSFTVTLTNPPAGAGSNDKTDLSFTTVGATATGGTDYVSLTNFTANNLVVGSFPYTVNVTINGDTTIENNETFFVDMTIGENDLNAVLTDPRGTGTIIDDDNGSGGGSVNEGIGHGDFIDTFITTSALSNAYNASADTSSYGLKFIKTKIASETTPLTAVYLNDFGVNADYDNNSSGDLDKKLWFAIPVLNDLDATGGCPSANSSLLQQIIDPATGQQVVFTVKDMGASDYSQNKNVIIPPNASKNAKIEMILVDTSKLNEDAQNCVEVSSTTGNLEGLGQCVNSEVQYVDAYGQTAYNRCAVSGTYGQPCLPANHGVGTGLFNSALGCFMCTFYAGTACSSDNFAIRPDDFNSTITPNQIFTAGTPESLTFRAEQNNGIIPTPNYNENENTSFTVAIDINDTTKTCAQPSINFSPIVDFTNGTVTDNYTLDNVGDFNLTIHETLGAEFALVDADDTNETLRLIEPFATQIKVIPHHFGIDGNLINGSNGFTYLSNFEVFDTNASRNISASLDLNISAETLSNAVTSNYTALCYAKDGNLTLTLANAINPNNPVAGSLSKLLWYHYTPDSNGSFPLDGVTTAYQIPFLSTQFDSNDTNGTAEFNYKINFDRNATKVVNPFMVVVNDLNATDTDGASGAKAGGNATFLFGRTHASRQRYEGPTGTANIYFESYCFTGCDKTLLNGFISPNMQRTDDVRWYINEVHAVPNDGNTGTAVEKDSIDKVRQISETIIVPPNSRVQKGLEYKYNGTNYNANTYPYKTTMKNNASNWLIQNEFDANATTNEFQVEFDNMGTWTGDNNTSITTNTPTDKAKTNRRIMW